MINVSFAMTRDAYADGSKTETRRFWKPAHAAKFTPGREFMGWTKDPRAGGVRIHPARVVSCWSERLGDMSMDSFEREGGTRYWRDREDYIDCMGGADLVVYVVRFEHLRPELLVRLTVRDLKTGSEWTEDYAADDLPDPNHMGRRRRDKRIVVDTQEEADAWGKGLVAWFNTTAAPGESRRELIKASLLPNARALTGGGAARSKLACAGPGRRPVQCLVGRRKPAGQTLDEVSARALPGRAASGQQVDELKMLAGKYWKWVGNSMSDSVVRFDGEVWPAAGSSLEALSHRLKSVHGELEARERYAAAEVVDAYRALLKMSRRAREERVKKIRLLSQEREASVR